MSAQPLLDSDEILRLRQDLQQREMITQQLQETIKDLEGQKDYFIDQNNALRVKLADANDVIDGLRDRLRFSDFDSIDSLVAARKLIKAGKYEDGRFELEKALDCRDSSWRTR